MGFSRGHQGRQGHRPHDDDDDEEEDDEVEDNDKDDANFSKRLLIRAVLGSKEEETWPPQGWQGGAHNTSF